MSEASERAARLAKRDAKIGGVCVLCYVGYPGGSWRCGPHHHIKPRGMGGTKDPFSEDERNLAPNCPPHHKLYEPNRQVWVKAMIKAGLYSEADYIGTPLEFYLSISDVSASKQKKGG